MQKSREVYSLQSVDWAGGLDWWTGLVNWTGGLDKKKKKKKEKIKENMTR